MPPGLTTGSYRCPVRGCPITSSSLRIMVTHATVHRAEIAAGECGIPGALRPALRLEPWQRDGITYLMRTRPTRPTGKMRAAMAALLRDARRPNRVIGVEAGGSKHVARTARRELEDAALIDVYRAPTPGRPGARPAVLRQAAMAALAADHQRSNRVIAAAIGVSSMLVVNARHDLENAGAIPVWRHRFTPGPRRPAAAVTPGLTVRAGLASAAAAVPSAAAAASSPSGMTVAEATRLREARYMASVS